MNQYGFFKPDVADTIDIPELFAYCEAYDDLYTLLLDITSRGLVGVADVDAVNTAMAKYDAALPGFTALITDPAISQAYPRVFEVISGLDMEFQGLLDKYKTLQVSADPSFDAGTQASFQRTEAYVQAHPEALTEYQRTISTAKTPDTIKKVLPFALGAIALYLAFKG